MIKSKSPTINKIPLSVVGSSKFGRYKKISNEQTYNMIISDEFLVPYSGFKKIVNFTNSGKGRGNYSSTRLGKDIAVVGNGVYLIDKNLLNIKVGTLSTTIGDVSIAENSNNQIAICDKSNIYIYNYSTNVFTKVTIDFTPSYIESQNGRFLAGVLNQPAWRLSQVGNGLSWPTSATPGFQGQFNTKPDNVKAIVRVPGKGNLIYIFGSTVIEPWVDSPVPSSSFPYQKVTTYNIDYGTINSDSIATLDDIICWIGINEKSGPIIMASNNGTVQHISTDGIDFQLATLSNPQDCHGSLFKQDGHLIYQVVFPKDNVSYAYDFNTNKIFTVCDENMNYLMAKSIKFFNNSYYFVSLNDGGFYELSTNYTTFDGNVIPRVRVCPTVRMPDHSKVIANALEILIEEGIDELESVDISMSKDGGYSFSSYTRRYLNTTGNRKNLFIDRNHGAFNELTYQFRFWGKNRFVVGNGNVGICQ